MVLGDLKGWTSQFVTADERLLERITFVWPKCAAILPAQADEDDITINLVNALGKDEIVRRICHWVEFQFEPFGTLPNGAKFSKGKIDIAFLLDWERERYIAYECKRLNVVYNGVRSSLAGPYVKDGMMRFVTEQYADGLPIGCMLGYVLDGDVAFALGQVHKAIKAGKSGLGLLTGPIVAPPINTIRRFLTTHSRAATNAKIEVRHALLPCLAVENVNQHVRSDT